jgi:dTDP-4-amino-4,6-dideoxygalactose transaminase
MRNPSTWTFLRTAASPAMRHAIMNINVTQPFLPPIEDYIEQVRGIWDRNWLTNHGPLVSKLEVRLAERLDAANLHYVSNGTIALQIAIKALQLSGEIITTAFSYVATTSTISWEGCTPIMVDIDPESLNIDPAKIEAAITDKTTGILATHVYGNPCDVEEIERIAFRNNLKVIYDAAHAFDVKFKGASIFRFGDIATTSFHATKIFHTIEGGAVISQDPSVARKVATLRNFGHVSSNAFDGVGINGKNSEFHAAMGLCNLDHVDDLLARRKEQVAFYASLLNGLPVKSICISPHVRHNNSYYPIVFSDEETLLRVVQKLELHRIFPRRYFYPSLSTLNYVNQRPATPISNDIASRVLCLPLYHRLSREEIELVSRLIRETLSV